MATKKKQNTSPQKTLTEEERKKKASSIQVLGLVILLLVLMATSAVTAFMAIGVIDLSSTTKYGPANSLTDAQFICDKVLKEEYGAKLQSIALDDLSSRENNKRDGYKLFYEMNLYRDASRKTGVSKFYVNCFVSAAGVIRQLDLSEEKTFAPKAGRRTTGNRFGI